MEKLLLVDDNEDVLEVLTVSLQGRFEVSATSVYSVASRLLKSDFDVVLIDYHLKNENGLELVKESLKIRERTYLMSTIPKLVNEKKVKVLDKLLFEFCREKL